MNWKDMPNLTGVTYWGVLDVYHPLLAMLDNGGLPHTGLKPSIRTCTLEIEEAYFTDQPGVVVYQRQDENGGRVFIGELAGAVMIEEVQQALYEAMGHLVFNYRGPEGLSLKYEATTAADAIQALRNMPDPGQPLYYQRVDQTTGITEAIAFQVLSSNITKKGQ